MAKITLQNIDGLPTQATENMLPPAAAVLATWSGQGLITADAGCYRLTDKGRQAAERAARMARIARITERAAQRAHDALEWSE